MSSMSSLSSPSSSASSTSQQLLKYKYAGYSSSSDIEMEMSLKRTNIFLDAISMEVENEEIINQPKASYLYSSSSAKSSPTSSDLSSTSSEQFSPLSSSSSSTTIENSINKYKRFKYDNNCSSIDNDCDTMDYTEEYIIQKNNNNLKNSRPEIYDGYKLFGKSSSSSAAATVIMPTMKTTKILNTTPLITNMKNRSRSRTRCYRRSRTNQTSSISQKRKLIPSNEESYININEKDTSTTDDEEDTDNDDSNDNYEDEKYTINGNDKNINNIDNLHNYTDDMHNNQQNDEQYQEFENSIAMKNKEYIVKPRRTTVKRHRKQYQRQSLPLTLSSSYHHYKQQEPSSSSSPTLLPEKYNETESLIMENLSKNQKQAQGIYEFSEIPETSIANINSKQLVIEKDVQMPVQRKTGNATTSGRKRTTLKQGKLTIPIINTQDNIREYAENALANNNQALCLAIALIIPEEIIQMACQNIHNFENIAILEWSEHVLIQLGNLQTEFDNRKIMWNDLMKHVLDNQWSVELTQNLKKYKNRQDTLLGLLTTNHKFKMQRYKLKSIDCFFTRPFINYTCLSEYRISTDIIAKPYSMSSRLPVKFKKIISV